MKSKILNLFIVVAIVMFFVWLPEPGHESNKNKGGGKIENEVNLIVNTTVFNGEGWQENVDVAFSKGIVHEVGPSLEMKYPDANIIDASRQYIIPGLIDAHTHTWGDALKQAVKFGVTTELDMFTNNAFAITQRQIRDKNSVNTQQADFFSAGTLATAPKGHGTEYGFEIPTINSAEQADDFVESRISEGSDYIKIVYNSTSRYMPSIDRDTLKALIQAAHKKQKLAVVHISDFESAMHAVAAGADGLVHGFMDKVELKPLIKLMTRNETFVIPTLSILNSMTATLDNNELVADFTASGFDLSTHKSQLNQLIGHSPNQTASAQAKSNIGELYKAGVKVLAGTDVPNTGTAHGISMHGEMELLVASGLTPTEALKSATSNPAVAFALAGRGVIKKGARADLVILNKDPRVSIRNTRSIDAVFKNGFKIETRQEDNSNKKIASRLNLGDFNKGLNSELKFDWMVTTDEMFKGDSKAKLERVELDGDGYINVSGSIGRKFSFPWAGVYLPLTKNNQQGLDLSEIKSVNFKAKGQQGDYRLLLFSTNQPMRPIEIYFTIGEVWAAQQLSLEKIDQGLLKSITGMALVAGKPQNVFNFDIDDIWLN